MTTAAPARKAKPNPSTAVIPATLTNEELMALLGQVGAVATQQSDYHRMTLRGGILETDDGDMFPPRKDGPSLRVRIVEPPVYYNAFFLSDKGEDGSVNAAIIGRTDLNGRFTRKYDDPAAQAADTNPANEVYDDIAKATGKRGSFKADIKLQIVPASGELTGEETIWTLTLSTTSVFEFRGSSRNPSEGVVSEKNFIVQLADLAVAQAVEAGADTAAQKTAVLNAMTSFRLGGVVADVYLPRTTNDSGNQTWTIISFVPVHIEPMSGEGTLALDNGSSDDGDVPF